jgi:hypothetical protein
MTKGSAVGRRGWSRWLSVSYPLDVGIGCIIDAEAEVSAITASAAASAAEDLSLPAMPTIR